MSAFSDEAPNLALSANLVPTSGGEPISISDDKFGDLSDNKRTLNETGLTNGYYTLMLLLASKSDTGTNLNTLVDSVRIVTGQTTTGTVTYPSLSGSASVVLSASPLMADTPLSIDGFSVSNGETSNNYNAGRPSPALHLQQLHRERFADRCHGRKSHLPMVSRAL